MHTFPSAPKPPSASRPSSRQSTLSSTRGKTIDGLRGEPVASLRTAKAVKAPLTSASQKGPRPSARHPRITAITTKTTTKTTTSAVVATPTTTSTRVLPPETPGRVTPRPLSSGSVLRPRDKNAVLATRSLNTEHSMSVTRAVPKMAPEKGQPMQSRQPPMPSLSAAAARGVGNRTPLTPKIAASSRSSTPQHHTVTVTSPLPRRGAPRADTTGASKDEVASPVAAFLNGNITPRSGSRQSRIDSANTTPTGTPTLDRQHDSCETRSGVGLAPSVLEADRSRRSTVSFTSLGPPDANTTARQDQDSKFFYANQAPKHQAQQQQQQQQQPRTSIPQQQKAPTFFYANGGAVPEKQNGPPTSLTPSTVSSPGPVDNHRASKFIYANGTPDLPPVGRTSYSSNPGSTVSTSSKLPTARLGPAAAPPASYVSQRPPSPVKLPSYTPPKNDHNSPLPTARSTIGSAPPLAPATTTILRTGTGAPAQSTRGHSRSKSVTAIDPTAAMARIASSHGSHAPPEAPSPSIPCSPTLSTIAPAAAAVGFSSLLQAAEDMANDDDDDSKSDVLHSPTKASSQEQALNELVASARRERKVQDLEITNASLEAINRTLERQLRKQTAELRRYRRLSRSGRLSLNSAPGRDRIVSDSTAGGGALARAGLDLDDLSEEESEVELEDAGFDDEDDLSPSESESGSGNRSPQAVALRDARHRSRDEARLQLDLSKHQQLLIDSQKINQSLKRCLGWTEELIREGRRALEYQVRVSEVKLGGRVLRQEDMEEREEEEETELDVQGLEVTVPDITHSDFDCSSPVITADDQWSKEPQDRDSGVELPTDGG